MAASLNEVSPEAERRISGALKRHPASYEGPPGVNVEITTVCRQYKRFMEKLAFFSKSNVNFKNK
jgi:hypothetical protein